MVVILTGIISPLVMFKIMAMVVPQAKLLATLTLKGFALEAMPPPAMVPKLWVAFRIVTPAVDVVSVPETGPAVELQPSLAIVKVRLLQVLAVVLVMFCPARLKLGGVPPTTPVFGTRAKRTSGLPERLSPHV